MTPEAQRIAIAKACGWTNYPVFEGQSPASAWDDKAIHSAMADSFPWISPSGKYSPRLPDYLNDLNSMAEAEQFAIFEEGAGSITASEEYGRQLIRIVLEVEEEGVPATLSGVAMVARATAAQRAESFLRTLNLWTE